MSTAPAQASDQAAKLPGQDVGVAHVLEKVREQSAAPRPPVVEFRHTSFRLKHRQAHWLCGGPAGRAPFHCFVRVLVDILQNRTQVRLLQHWYRGPKAFPVCKATRQIQPRSELTSPRRSPKTCGPRRIKSRELKRVDGYRALFGNSAIHLNSGPNTSRAILSS